MPRLFQGLFHEDGYVLEWSSLQLLSQSIAKIHFSCCFSGYELVMDFQLMNQFDAQFIKL